MKLGMFLLPLLGACAADGGVRNPAAETRLTQALAGKVAGAPQRCLARALSDGVRVVDANTILYPAGRDVIYRNNPEGGCPGLDPSRTIAVEQASSEMCRGDVVRVVDRTGGGVVSSCTLSDFVPYRRENGS